MQSSSPPRTAWLLSGGTSSTAALCSQRGWEGCVQGWGSLEGYGSPLASIPRCSGLDSTAGSAQGQGQAGAACDVLRLSLTPTAPQVLVPAPVQPLPGTCDVGVLSAPCLLT